MFNFFGAGETLLGHAEPILSPRWTMLGPMLEPCHVGTSWHQVEALGHVGAMLSHVKARLGHACGRYVGACWGQVCGQVGAMLGPCGSCVGATLGPTVSQAGVCGDHFGGVHVPKSFCREGKNACAALITLE